MTVFLDTDAYPCGSFLNVFELMRDRPSAIDIADAVAPVPFGGSYGDRLESFETGADGWSDFHERNTGGYCDLPAPGHICAPQERMRRWQPRHTMTRGL
eukprot:scaffold1449_cov324-Prasinococcus_capsulatus_cf.AAC.8